MFWKRVLCATVLNITMVCSDSTEYESKANRSTVAVMPCDEGWLYFRDKCYRRYETSVTWNEAAELCVKNGGHLASIRSREEVDFLVAYLLRDEVDVNVYIGLHDPDKKDDFIWHDGSPLNFEYWMQDSKRANEHCVEMLLRHFAFDREKYVLGQWNDIPCEDRRPYVCQRIQNTTKQTPDPKYCSPDEGGGRKFQTTCYHVVAEQKTWNEAEEHCVKKFNGHLVTISDLVVDFFMSHLLHQLEKEVWIGIKIRDQFQQKWASGWHVAYDGGLAKGHAASKEGSCVTRVERRVWTRVQCTERLPFVCETHKAVSPVLKPAAKGYRCPGKVHNWRDLGGEFCYLIQAEQRVTWYRANFECKVYGGHLFSIHSKEESDILHPFVKYTYRDIHLGLMRLPQNRDLFEWVDGTPLDYYNWDFQQPDDKEAECGEISTAKMAWNDENCDRILTGYICSVKKLPPDTSKKSGCSSATSQISSAGLISISVASILIVIALTGLAIYWFRCRGEEQIHHQLASNLGSFDPRSTNNPSTPAMKLSASEEEPVYEEMEYSKMDFYFSKNFKNA